MRVVVKVSAYYDWDPISEDVKVTPADLKSGRVKPAANGSMVMKVTRTRETETTVMVTEEAIVQRIIHEMMPNQGCVPHSRIEAVGQLIARQALVDQTHPKFMKSFTVECDDGPNEAVFRKLVEPFTTAIHQLSGQPLIPAEDMDALLARYMAKTTVQDHIEHLHAKFNVKKETVK